jgi:hypothetical protein
MNRIGYGKLALKTTGVFLVVFLSIISVRGEGTDDLLKDKSFASGEKMYRAGILPSGKSMKTSASGMEAVPGSSFSCASCHTRSGLSPMEDGSRTLSINGAKLFQPRYGNFQSLTAAERKTMLPERYKTDPLRSAYSGSTLAIAIRTGVDPSGRALNNVMPRYDLSDNDMLILISYLKQLSSEPSPGVDNTTMAFATVITSEVDPTDVDAFINTLELGIKSHNNLRKNPGKMGVMLSMQVMRDASREWTLDKWVLTGSPNTWNQQLEDLYKKRPVFALIGGISTLPWEPIHKFCETNKIPCILPFTDLPVISTTDTYTLYFSKGYYQEGEAAAAHLEKIWDKDHPRKIIQIVDRGPEAKALAEGFQNAWSELGHGHVDTVVIKEGSANDDLVAALTRADANSIRLLWTGPESLSALQALAETSRKPFMVFMSATRLATRLWDLPAKARPFTFITYPFREPGPKAVIPKMGGKPVVISKEFKKNDRRIASKTKSIVEILNIQIPAMEKNFYRDYLVDLFSTMTDINFTDYENLLYSPGQNYGSEHCHIMQLLDDPDPKLVRKDN